MARTTALLHCHRPAELTLGLWPQERFGFTCPGTFFATPNAAVRGREKEQWLFEWELPEGQESQADE